MWFPFSGIPGVVNYTDISANSLCQGNRVELEQRTTELQQDSTADLEEPRRPSSFRERLSTFAASTSAHGVGNIAAASSLARRVVWFVVTVVMYAALFMMCASLVMRYLTKPVVSRMEMSFEEVSVVRNYIYHQNNLFVKFIEDYFVPCFRFLVEKILISFSPSTFRLLQSATWICCDVVS